MIVNSYILILVYLVGFVVTALVVKYSKAAAPLRQMTMDQYGPVIVVSVFLWPVTLVLQVGKIVFTSLHDWIAAGPSDHED